MTKKGLDPIDDANEKSLEDFNGCYMPDGEDWRGWTHPVTKVTYSLSLQTSTSLPVSDFESCFNLISETSSADYKVSKDGWKPRAKKKEMRLLDMKYIIVKRTDSHQLEGFMSFMPTYEDDFPVVYLYEIHLGSSLQGSGLGKSLMIHLDTIALKIPSVEKVMLTVFVSNQRGIKFYEKLRFEKDENSPEPKRLRDGTMVASDYDIFSKAVVR